MKKGGKRRRVVLEHKKCDREGCDIVFPKYVHNQRFHNKECCQLYTNAKLLEKYYESKKVLPSGRVCNTRSCTTILSKYNKGIFCALCKEKETQAMLRQSI